MNPDNRPLTKEETDLLPFDFLNAYYAAPDSTNTSYYFARWHGRLAYSIDLNRGWCYEDDDTDITLDHWEDHYPGFRYLNNHRVAPYLCGTHNGRSVRWSRSQHHWEYLNHRPVDFSHEEEEQVTELLESATLSTSRALSSLTPVPQSTPDPESRTQPVPGELPESPRPIPVSAATSSKGKHPISTVPSRSSTPAPSSSLVPPPLATSRPTAVPRPLTTMSTAPPKLMGSPPESFDGSGHKAESFWSSLETYYFLNQDVFQTDSKHVASALTHFKLGTPAGEWARDRQQTALALQHPDFGSWDDFRSAFKAHFIPVESKMSSTQTMHSLRQQNCPFHEWYQEWITHANCSRANEQTKIFTFCRNIHPSLHVKLLGVSPIPTTLSRLAKLAKEFDQSFWMWSANPSTSSSPQNFWTNPRIHVSDADTPGSTQINANSPSHMKPSRPQQGGSKKFGPFSQEEKGRRRRNNLCSYCGGQNHFADQCPKKPFRPSSSSRQNVYRVRGAQLIEEENDQSLEEGEILETPTVSRLYHEPASIYDVDIPDPDPDSQDF